MIISLPVGSLLAGPLMDRFGRKPICILTCVPSILSWLLIIFAPSLPQIYTGRIIAGISAGMSSVSVVYVLEITHPKIRGMMLCLNSVFVSLGILLVCILALLLDWRKIAMVFTALTPPSSSCSSSSRRVPTGCSASAIRRPWTLLL